MALSLILMVRKLSPRYAIECSSNFVHLANTYSALTIPLGHISFWEFFSGPPGLRRPCSPASYHPTQNLPHCLLPGTPTYSFMSRTLSYSTWYLLDITYTQQLQLNSTKNITEVMFPGYKFQTLSPKLVDYSANYDQSMVNKLVALAYLLHGL